MAHRSEAVKGTSSRCYAPLTASSRSASSNQGDVKHPLQHNIAYRILHTNLDLTIRAATINIFFNFQPLIPDEAIPST